MNVVVAQMRKESHGRVKNREIKEMYGDNYYEVQSLRKKLEKLERAEGSQLTSIPKRNQRSFSQNIKV
jgi:hypothetical protein